MRWAAFWRLLLAAAAGSAALVYLFVVLVDPWGMLPFSPRLPRVPISTNARYSFPALAQSPRFDSAILGTSTARLLRPAMLDPLFGARFVNLAMNSATAWEQWQLLRVFLRSHARPRVVMIGLDAAWCVPGALRRLPPPAFMPQPFPAWMYGGARWRGYLAVMNLYTVQEAANQFAVMAGFKRQRYGSDGYTNFLPADGLYDPARARRHLAEQRAPSDPPPPGFDPTKLHFATLDVLAHALGAVPVTTQKLLFFVPYHTALQGAPGSEYADVLAACKQRVTALARGFPATVLADFMMRSPITTRDDNYWDPHHFRIGIAERVMRDLAEAAEGRQSAAGDYVLPLQRPEFRAAAGSRSPPTGP
jgi:hypothetical protein